MTFKQIIKTVKNNKQTLLDFMGYYTIEEFRDDNGFDNNRDSFNYIKDEYNREVKLYNYNEKNIRIINPLTNKLIKKYSILKLDGNIRDKYIDKIVFKNGELVKNTIIIALNTDNNEYAKFNIETIDQPFLQQNFGVTVPKSVIIPNTTYANIKFKHYFEPDEEAVSIIKIKYTVTISEDTKKLSTIKERNFTGRQIVGIPETPIFDDNPLWYTDIVQFYIALINEDPNIDQLNARIESIDDISITSSLNNATMNISDMILREQKPLNINNLFNEVIDTKFNHCIHDYLIERYPKYSVSIIKTLNNVNDIYEWCLDKNIKMRAFDINGNVIKTNDPTKSNRIKSLNFIAYNNHLYPILNPYLKKVKIKKYSIKIITNIKDKLLYYLDKCILPRDIKINNNNEIYSFLIYDEDLDGVIMYLENDDYYKCLEILEIFGIKDKMTPSIKLKHLGSLIENLYKSKDTNSNSFFPMGSEFNVGGYNYNNEDMEIEDNNLLYTVDKVKSYSYTLSKLPYLIVCDIKYHRNNLINEIIEDHIITPHYLYIIDIDESTIILPNNNMFEGNTLIKARECGLKFRIIEEQETSKINNYFKDMVNDLYKKIDNDSFKQIMNVLIGKFECSSNIVNNSFEFDKIINADEMLSYNGYTQQLNNNYYACMKTTQNINIFNRKPIAIQVKDRSRLLIFDMMNKLGLKNNDIKQIKTDSITFIKHNDEVEKYLHNEISGWKIEQYKEIKNPLRIKRQYGLSFKYKNYNNTGTLALGDAGNGKTYQIINNVIPKLITDKKSYIVLSPSHATITEYKQNNLNCDVVQKYLFKQNYLPVEDVIIVDEIGMIGVSGWNMLYKCKLIGKDIRVYGDMGQLIPVESKLCDNPNFFNLMFKNQITLNKNYRNNFTKQYYNKLKTKSIELAHQEVLKYNTQYNKAEVIIAFNNDTRKKYNKRMCEKLGINNLFDVGTKIICKTNKLSDHNIYNNFCFTIDNVVNEMYYDKEIEMVYFTDGSKLPLFLLIKKSYFDYAYARTLYSVQGQTLQSFYYALEDLQYLDGRALYTLISRLKQ